MVQRLAAGHRRQPSRRIGTARSRFDAPETLVEHIRKMKAATDRPWGVNVPLMYPEIDRLMDILIREEVKIVFTSAGSPKKFTPDASRGGRDGGPCGVEQ